MFTMSTKKITTEIERERFALAKFASDSILDMIDESNIDGGISIRSSLSIVDQTNREVRINIINSMFGIYP